MQSVAEHKPCQVLWQGHDVTAGLRVALPVVNSGHYLSCNMLRAHDPS